MSALMFGCAKNQTVESSTCQPSLDRYSAVSNSSADRSILTLQPCGPPCWQDLYPGSSSAPEVLSRLQELAFVDAKSIRRIESSDSIELEAIHWESAVSNYITSSHISIGNDGMIRYIQIRLDVPVRLEELLQLYEEPSGYSKMPLNQHTATNCNRLDIVWLESGLWVSTVYANGDESSLRNAIVSPVIYFAPATSFEAFTEELQYGYVEHDYQPWTSLKEIAAP
jgi:hypothetical protein